MNSTTIDVTARDREILLTLLNELEAKKHRAIRQGIRGRPYLSEVNSLIDKLNGWPGNFLWWADQSTLRDAIEKVGQ